MCHKHDVSLNLISVTFFPDSTIFITIGSRKVTVKEREKKNKMWKVVPVLLSAMLLRHTGD